MNGLASSVPREIEQWQEKTPNPQSKRVCKRVQYLTFRGNTGKRRCNKMLHTGKKARYTLRKDRIHHIDSCLLEDPSPSTACKGRQISQ